MKSFKDYSGEELDEGSPTKHTGETPPAVLVMKRVSIRQFPDGQNIALYRIEKLDKYVSIPYGKDILQAQDKVTK